MREPKRANEILRKASAFFAAGPPCQNECDIDSFRVYCLNVIKVAPMPSAFAVLPLPHSEPGWPPPAPAAGSRLPVRCRV